MTLPATDGFWEKLHALLTYDALTMTFRKVSFPQNPDCAVCGDHRTITAL